MKQYLNRPHAGQLLASELQHYRGRADMVVLGLPRGGVPVAAEVARDLQAPLDIVVVRKIGVRSQPEVAMGALAAIGGKVETVRNKNVMDALGSGQQVENMFREVAAEELAELERREESYRAGRPSLSLAGRLVVLVDDGLATGATMRAAIAVVRSQSPARVVVAVPVAMGDACTLMETVADDVVCLWTPTQFRSVGQAYQEFGQTTDEEVQNILAAAQEAKDDRRLR